MFWNITKPKTVIDFPGFSGEMETRSHHQWYEYFVTKGIQNVRKS